MRYLFIVAHPDDEVLGAGATINKLIEEGNEVAICTMSNHPTARANISNTLGEDQKKAMAILGVKNTYSANFPNIKMNIVPHLDVVHFIESCIDDFQAEAIFTHHPSDLNNDHVITSCAAQVASRLSQRRDGIPKLRLLAFMEVVSSTEWSYNSSHNQFVPSLFVEIGEQGLDLKMKALEMYKGVVRDYPHPRSNEGIRALATWRGSQAGCNFAEAFECVFRCV